MSKIFPPVRDYRIETKNPQIQIYGHRIYKDQTLYEYLLEFLTIFISPKGKGDYSDLADTAFTLTVPTDGEKLYYYPSPNMGLKRFVFFNRSDQEKRFDIDKEALKQHREQLAHYIVIENDVENYTKEFAINALQDLLYGFNSIVGKRSWFAQSLLPLSPEIVFCESIGNQKERTLMKMDHYSDNNRTPIDSKFNFDQHMFMARGGEVYYLHLVQGLNMVEEYNRLCLSQELKKLVTNIPQLSKIANFVQSKWEETMNEEKPKAKLHYIKKTTEIIPSEYSKYAPFTVDELSNILTSELDPFEKIELVGVLIPIQIMRIMSGRASQVLNMTNTQEWLIDLTKDSKGVIRKRAVESYEQFEENVFRAIHEADFDGYKTANPKQQDDTKIIMAAAKDTNMLVRKLGKEIGLIIPLKGPNMRFSLNENLVKVLVMSLIKPGERILFTTFLKKCYEHFNIIIGPKEAAMHFSEEPTYLVAFNENEQMFLEMLKNSGFLRNLSDATSTILNQ